MNSTSSNLYKFSNYKDKKFIFIGKYNTLLEHTDLVEDILMLLPSHKEEEIIGMLGNKYSNINVRDQMKIIKEWISTIKMDNEKRDDLHNNVREEDWYNGKLLTSLWLNISHDCNLNCIYCYGDGGNYGRSKKLMTMESAKKIIDYWFKYLDKDCKKVNVVFFGGEPLMNKKVLFFAVNYINELLKKEKIINYALTTNATIMDEEILELFAKNRFNITLSMDGEKKIQDKNRPYISGKGTFDKVKETIGFLKKYYTTLTARLTLTHENVSKLKKSVESLWEIGITHVACEMVCSTNENLRLTKEDLEILKPQIHDLAKITYKHILNNDNRQISTLLKYAKAMHNHSCNECTFFSKNSLMVEPDGEIFKCHRLIGEEEFLVGNISTEMNWSKYAQDKKVDSKCTSCWAKSMCFNCPQVNYIYNKDLYTPYDLSCEFTKMMIKENLSIYASLYEKDPKILNKIYKLQVS